MRGDAPVVLSRISVAGHSFRDNQGFHSGMVLVVIHFEKPLRSKPGRSNGVNPEALGNASKAGSKNALRKRNEFFVSRLAGEQPGSIIPGMGQEKTAWRIPSTGERRCAW